jgi:hypothetical protein
MDANYGNGMSPADYAAVASRGNGVFGGGDGGGLLMGLLFSQLFNGRAFGAGAAVAGATGLADAAAAAAVTSAKDAVAATQATASALDSNIDALSKQCCCSTQDIISAINEIAKQCCCSTQQIMSQIGALSPQMMKGFFDAQIQTLQSQNAISSQLDSHAGEAQVAMCRQENLINTTSAALMNQNSAHHAATSNQMAQQTCEIEKTVLADGQATRTLINSIETDRLRTEFADAKVRISNQEQTASIVAMMQKCFSCGCNSGNGTNGNGNNS